MLSKTTGGSDAILADVARVRELLSSQDGEYEVRDFIPQLYRIHDYDKMGNRPVGTVDCGSFRLPDTPKSLYRALFLLRPVSVSFVTENQNIIRPAPTQGDMYKQCILTIVSPDYDFVATLEFFKYELALYFSASEKYITGRRSCVISGAPGSDNGIQYRGPEPEAWFGLLKELLTREWMVYGGNDFSV
jgi:hypothetical protein